MNLTSDIGKSLENAGIRVNTISLDHPWQWLAKGWKDLTSAPTTSLSFGLIYVIASYFLTWALVSGSMFFLIPPLAAGFFLIAPLLGIGLYAVSRDLEQKRTVDIKNAVKAFKSNQVHLSAMGIVLMFLLLIWMLAANIVFALFFQKPVPPWQDFIPVVFLSGDSPLFLFMGIVSGGIIAAIAFAISAISVPLLMDSRVDVMTAIQTSFSAILSNWRPMLLWASLIVMFVGVGIVTFYIGLAICMPLVGHATWHAYRDLIDGPSD